MITSYFFVCTLSHVILHNKASIKQISMSCLRGALSIDISDMIHICFRVDDCLYQHVQSIVCNTALHANVPWQHKWSWQSIPMWGRVQELFGEFID